LLTFNTTYSQPDKRVINLILFSDFTNPPMTISALKDDIVNTGFIDSIRIVGCPIHATVVTLRIDTLRAIQFGFDINTLGELIADSPDASKCSNDLAKLLIKNTKGDKVPASGFASLYLTAGFKDKDIFLPGPEVFYYKNQRAILLELHYDPVSKKKLVEHIKRTIDAVVSNNDPSGSISTQGVEYELIYSD
jgi:hypothetical protein